jgi:hypothetical protein
VHQYDATESEAKRVEWLLTAIFVRDGEDLRHAGLALEELEEQWFDEEAAQEPGPDRYPGVSYIDLFLPDSMMTLDLDFRWPYQSYPGWCGSQ